MLVTSCMLVIVIQTKFIAVVASEQNYPQYPDYFDHAATIPESGYKEKTTEDFPLPDLKPWGTLFPTPTPKPNTTKATSTTKTIATQFFFIASANLSDAFTVTESTVTTKLEPYLTGFMTTRGPPVTFPVLYLLSTMAHLTTDIIIPPRIAAPYKMKFTLATKTVAPKAPKKVLPITLHTKGPPVTTTEYPSRIPKMVDRSGLNSSASKTMEQPLDVSPTAPTNTSQTVATEATTKTNTTNPSVNVSSTANLTANTTTSPNNNTLTTVTTISMNPIPELNNVTTVNLELNKTANLTSKNETGEPTVSLNATNVQIPNTTTTIGIVGTPRHEDPTTTPVYEDVIEYEELTTEPFSKFVERLLFTIAKMNKTYATRFLRSFERIATSKANGGSFHSFGPGTIRYIEETLPGLEESTDTLQRMLALGYSNLKSRRKTLAVDTNKLLDYMDMVYLPEEENLMQEILNHTMRYPNTTKSSADICTDIISGLIVMPSKRISGTKKGNELFISLENLIVSRHPEYDHNRKNFENKGEAIVAITDPVGKSNRRNVDSFHYANVRRLKALHHVSEFNRKYGGSIRNAKGKKRKAMPLLNKDRRKWINVNKARNQYYRINNALRRAIEPTNHGTESKRRNYGSILNDKIKEIEDTNHVNGEKRKYGSIIYSEGRKRKAIRNFNKANGRKYKMARKKLHNRRFKKENLRRSYNTIRGKFQKQGWIRNARETDNNNYNGEADNVDDTFSDSDEFVQSESDDENDKIESQRKANIVFDRIQKLKSKNVIEPVMKAETVKRQEKGGWKNIKWGLPSWNPNENEFGVLRQEHHPSQRRTDRKNNLQNNRGLLLKKGVLKNNRKFEMFREGRQSSEMQPQKVIIQNKNNNNVLGIGPQYDNVNFSAPMKLQLQDNIRPVKKSFVSRQRNMLRITKRFHNYKPKMAEVVEPSPSFLNLMEKILINRTSNVFTTERYAAITPYTNYGLIPQEILNNNSNNLRNYNEMNKIIGNLNPSNARTNQQVMSVDFDDSPNIIDFSVKVKLKKSQDARDGGELVFVKDHRNMRGREAQVTEETRTRYPHQMDKYFAKTEVARRDIKKRYARKPVSDTSDDSDSDMSKYERDVDDEDSEQDESDSYTFKGVNRKNTHSKHHHKIRVNRRIRKSHDKYKHKKRRRPVRLRHGTHKKNRNRHGLRSNTKIRKHGRNKHSHHKNHRYYKNKRGRTQHIKKHAMAVDPIRKTASDTRPIPVGNLYTYDKEEYAHSEAHSSINSTEQRVGISAPENKKYKPIGKLMELDTVSTLRSNVEIETFKKPIKVNSPERAENEAQPKNSQEVKDLENKDKNTEGNVNRRNPKRRGGYVTIGLLMDDMVYKFRENELKRNVYDAFRQNYRRNYRRTMGKEFHPPVLPAALVIREDSVYTDDEAILKMNIYKAIKQNAHMLDQNEPKVLRRKF